MLQVVNEESTCYVTASFYDKNAALAAPSSASYRIDDEDGTAITANTALTAATQIEITINPTENRILDDSHPYETRVLSVEGLYASSQGVRNEFRYKVKNLSFLS